MVGKFTEFVYELSKVEQNFEVLKTAFRES